MTQDSPYINDPPSSQASATTRPRRGTTTDTASSCSQMPVRARDSGLTIPDTPRDVYHALIANNNLVCQTCYRRLHRQTAYPTEQGHNQESILAFVDKHVPAGADYELVEAEFFEQEELRQRKPKCENQRYCWNCGSEQPHRTQPPRSLDDAIEAAAGISATLEEYNVTHDWMALFVATRTFKTTPEVAGDDDDVFELAVALAVRFDSR